MNIEEFKTKIERLVNMCIEALAKGNAFFDSTRKRYELKINKYSETIFLCNSAIIRIKPLKNKKINLELSKKYIDLFKLQDIARYTKSDANWGKFTFDDYVAKRVIDNIDEVFKQCYMEESAESFSCCSKYVECSDQKKCIHPDIKFAQDCKYKKNLENGRIFYGKNCNIEH